MKPHKISHVAQVLLRIFAVVASAISAWLMITAKQDIVVLGIPISAKYSYSPAFKFTAIVNVVGSALALLSLCVNCIAMRQGNPTNYVFLFMHDLVMMSLLLGGSAAATAIGYIGKHGDRHAGWLPICDQLSSFCNRVFTAVILSYASAAFFLFLAIISVTASRPSHFSSM
ncbi:hypothetical protein Nepgr_002954 [Nepenthes gracilis]|uniref:CASP-like protein n=1 Tax=Nepenthes gracilis TaxID=150966 RepID=A0AAD3RYM1_NEPGR|nr:hypothetical protein Nepgr_002954 [Nepenthes gracilis]